MNKGNNRMVINGEEYVLHKKIPSDMEDVHHIISKKLIHTFKVNDPKNKVKLQRIKHVHLNGLFGSEAQNPKAQLEVMYNIRKTALSEEVNKALYDILQLDDEVFYDYDLVKRHKILKDKI